MPLFLYHFTCSVRVYRTHYILVPASVSEAQYLCFHIYVSYVLFSTICGHVLKLKVYVFLCSLFLNLYLFLLPFGNLPYL